MNQAVSADPITMKLAAFVAGTRPGDLPQAVDREAVRALVNVMGCALGGSRHEAVAVMRDAFAGSFGAPVASLFGIGGKADMLHAAYINGLSAAADSYDDSHADVILHPSGPVACALFALAEARPMSGRTFLLSFALGIEVICRLSKAISFPSRRGPVGWIQTGITGGIGTAAAVSRALGLDAERTAWAMGIAAAQAAGMRGVHGTMCTSLIPAQVGRAGLEAALLAERGFTSTTNFLEHRYGLAALYATDPDLGSVVAELGSRFDLLRLVYKPYPSGIVLNPIIEACLDLHRQAGAGAADIAAIEVTAHPTAVAITDRLHPASPLDAQLSLQHWAAVAVAAGLGGVEALEPAQIDNPQIRELRTRVSSRASDAYSPEGARVTVRLADGREFASEVIHAIGSIKRPMSEAQVEAKFRGQATRVLGTGLDAALHALWNIAAAPDAGDVARLLAPR